MKKAVLIFNLFVFHFICYGSYAIAWDIEGTVRMKGTPKPRYGGVSPQESQVCGGIIKRVEDLMVGNQGELKNAVVWVEEAFTSTEIAKAESQTLKMPQIMNQTHCQFEPRVLLAPIGSEVFFHSSDVTVHHVAIYSPEGKNQHETLLKNPSAVARWKFRNPGPHLLRCGFHPWMGAVVFVRRHPFYAVTDQGGRYQIKNLPRQARRVLVWHEVLGFVETTPDKSGRADIVFESGKSLGK